MIMKRFLTIIAILALSLGTALGQEARQQGGKNDKDWWQKVQTEKIAYFTSEMSLTTEEAQAFWPVYNAYQSRCNEAHMATMKALWTMKKAFDDNANNSGKDAQNLLDDYLEAYRTECKTMSDFPNYSGILPPEKEAKLYVAEEMFRMKMIGKLKNGRSK